MFTTEKRILDITFVTSASVSAFYYTELLWKVNKLNMGMFIVLKFYIVFSIFKIRESVKISKPQYT